MSVSNPAMIGKSGESRPDAAMSPPVSNACVLVVDDHEDTRFMLRTLLESRGASVVEAADGLTAIARAASVQPDLILIDGRLPLMDGFEATSQIREGLSTRHVPIVFLSGDGRPTARARAFAVGCTDYLVKPIDFDAWDILMEQYLAPAGREIVYAEPGMTGDLIMSSTAHDPDTAPDLAVDPEPELQSPVSRILIIDHDTVTAELIQLMLQNSTIDCEITSVLSPDEGLRLAAAKRFDLYVLDYRLAAMTGVEVCRTLRLTDAETPIMFFTGEPNPEERQEAMAAGADDYLVKPDDIRKLTETVNRLLNKSQLAPIEV